jgi:hypothetical protein
LFATRASDGITLAIEHRVIQPHPREKEDFARFSRSSLITNDRDESLEIPQSFLYVNVPIDTLQRGQDWSAAAHDVHECIRRAKDSISEGRSELLCSIGSDEITLYIEYFPQLALIDEIWIAETHDDRHSVLFDPVVPGRGYAPVYTFSGDTLQYARSS